MDARAVRDVVVDGAWERVRFLHHYPEAAAQPGELLRAGEHVAPVDGDDALDSAVWDGLDEAIEGSEHGALARARGTEKNVDSVPVEIEMDVSKRAVLAVVNVDTAKRDFDLRVLRHNLRRFVPIPGTAYEKRRQRQRHRVARCWLLESHGSINSR